MEKIKVFVSNAKHFGLEVQGTLKGGGAFAGTVKSIGTDTFVVWAEEVRYADVDWIGFC